MRAEMKIRFTDAAEAAIETWGLSDADVDEIVESEKPTGSRGEYCKRDIETYLARKASAKEVEPLTLWAFTVISFLAAAAFVGIVVIGIGLIDLALDGIDWFFGDEEAYAYSDEMPYDPYEPFPFSEGWPSPRILPFVEYEMPEQVDFEAGYARVPEYFLHLGDSEALFAGLASDLEPLHGSGWVDSWIPKDEIVWATATEREGKYIDVHAIETMLVAGGGFSLDIPLVYTDDPAGGDVDVVIAFGAIERICGPGSSLDGTMACVNEVGAAWLLSRPCELAMPPSSEVDPDTLMIDASDERYRRNAHLSELVQHEFGHCLGLTHELDGVMKAPGSWGANYEIWEPDVVTPVSELEREVVQAILDGLRERQALSHGGA